MAAPYRKLLAIFVIALLAFVIIGGFIWPLVSIQLRLSRNGRIAHQLVESLQARFPKSEFGGAASYEREIIYIQVRNRLNQGERREIETWLREQKNEQKIAPQIWIRFLEDKEDNDIIIK
jgi:hypothetical protein